LTGDDCYLEPYRQALTEASGILGALPDRAEAEQLRPMASDELNATLELRRSPRLWRAPE
jgi:hypothetical protein